MKKASASPKLYVCTAPVSSNKLVCSVTKELVATGHGASERKFTRGTLDIVYKTLPVDELTAAIYGQWAWAYTAYWDDDLALEISKTFSINARAIPLGSAADPRAPVYGYNDNQTLDVNGGIEKSYAPDFNTYLVDYRSVSSDLLPTIRQDDIKATYDRIIPYYFQRGYQLFNNDYPEKLRGVHYSARSDGAFVGLKLNLNRTALPTSVDVWAMVVTVQEFYLDTYEPNESLRSNRGFYPVRVPVTTDLSEFRRKYDATPIAYFNKSCMSITIKIPAGSNIKVGATDNFGIEAYLNEFEGTFALMKRDSRNKIVLASPSNFQYMVQNVSTVTITSKTTRTGLIKQIIEFQDSSNTFTALVLKPVGSGSPGANIYIFPDVEADGFQSNIQPNQIYGDASFGFGDNPLTKLREIFGIPSLTKIIDNIQWNNSAFRIPSDMLLGNAYPEERDAIELVSPLIKTGTQDATRLYISHELGHSMHYGMDIIVALPFEAMATALHLDPALNEGIAISFHIVAVSRAIINLTRGVGTMMQSDVMDIGPEGGTYGRFIFWNYMREQFDFNQQVGRRVSDILNTKSLGPYIKSLGFTNTIQYFPVNPTGGSQALSRALDELHGLDVRDVWTDFSISLVMVRNNTSIPAKYRHTFPFWIASDKYIDFQTLYDRLVYFAGSYVPVYVYFKYTNWWDQLQENTLLVDTAPGQTFLRTLPLSLSVESADLRAFSFNIPQGTTQINLNVARGDWRCTVVRFTSDGTSVGQFGQLPSPGQTTQLTNGQSHRFDLTGLVGTGNTRLVCVHVSINSAGLAADFFEPEPITGSLSLSRDGPRTPK